MTVQQRELKDILSNGNLSFKEAAINWFKFGFDVIPIVPSSKKTACKWDPWLDGLSIEKITQHWKTNPEHEIGFVVGDRHLVLDTDTPEAKEAAWEIMRKYGCPPLLEVETKRGQHLYFSRDEDSKAKSSSHSTENHPERIDIKTGRSIIILPPSPGKKTQNIYVNHASELITATQDFIDALFDHNGQKLPSQAPTPSLSKKSIKTSEAVPRERYIPIELVLARIKLLLEHIDPDCSYDDWLHILMAIHYESEGSEEGFSIANEWSKKGNKYCGERALMEKWNSFQLGLENSYYFLTIAHKAEESGIDWLDVCGQLEEQFEVLDEETVVVAKESAPKPQPSQPKTGNIFDQFEELESRFDEGKHTVEPVIGNLANKGELTVFYAAPNVGKTLITLSLLIESINEKRVNPANVYYINLDDSGAGLQVKRRIAKQHGFKMFTERADGFEVNKFKNYIEEFIKKGLAKDMILILDTIKKFTDVMDKSGTSEFNKSVRKFAINGGTAIVMAHTNKNLAEDGTPVPGGTSDIIDDFDCAFILRPIPDKNKPNERVVQFINRKQRANAIKSVTYKYDNREGISYMQRLLSVMHADDNQNKTEPSMQPVNDPDSVLIDAIVECIEEGINSKMAIKEEAANRAGTSKSKALKMLEERTGDDPERHSWNYKVVRHGTKEYFLLKDDDRIM